MLGEYTIVCDSQEEGGFCGQCVELPEAISQGETIKELKVNIIDAINLVIKSIQE